MRYDYFTLPHRSGYMQRMPRVASSTFEFQYSTYFWYALVASGGDFGQKDRTRQIRCADGFFIQTRVAIVGNIGELDRFDRVWISLRHHDDLFCRLILSTAAPLRHRRADRPRPPAIAHPRSRPHSDS